MNISKFTSDEDFRSLIKKKIASDIKRPKYLGEYKEWAKRKKAGHSIDQIVAHTEATKRTVKQGLYAMDLINDPPTSVTSKMETDMILDYYQKDMSNSDLAEKYGVHSRKPGWIVRNPALRLMIDFDVEELEAEEFSEEEVNEIRNRMEKKSGSRDRTATKSEEEIAKEWKSKNGELGPNGRNVTARVKETTAV